MAKRKTGDEFKAKAFSLPLESHFTSFQEISIRPWDNGWMLYLDGAQSSFIDPENPLRLEFEYQQHFDLLVQSASSNWENRPFTALHLGAGACALARAWDQAFPQSAQLAVEIDEGLGTLVREVFHLPRSPRLRIRIGEASGVLATLRPGSFSVLVRDVFASSKVPPSCDTPDFYHNCRRVLTPQGLALFNVPSTVRRLEMREMVAELIREVPGGNLEKNHVLPEGTDPRQAPAPRLAALSKDCIVALADPKVWRRARVGNIVVGLNLEGWDFLHLERSVRGLPLPARVFDLNDF